MIHPTAVISGTAEIDPSARIGPFAVIDEGVRIGPGCVIGPYVYVTGRATLGARNRIHAGCVIGDTPQDLKYKDAPTSVAIGDDNVLREHVTVHRSNQVDKPTTLGSHNFLMQHCHVAHDCSIADHVVVASGTMLGGHVHLADRAFLSANCLVHQFVRVGTLAMMQGGSAISKDLPPYCMIRRGDLNLLCGLNTIGLRRAGIAAEDRLELKQLYHQLFRPSERFNDAVAAARAGAFGAVAGRLIEFVSATKLGICLDGGPRSSKVAG